MPELNAAGLAAMIVATLLAVLKRRRESITAAAAARGALLAFGYLIVLSVFSAHLCLAGNPVRQFTISTICLLLILTTVRPRVARWLGSAVAVAGAVLTFHAVELVHDGYPTNPQYGERQQRTTLQFIGDEMRAVAEKAGQSTTNPASSHRGTTQPIASGQPPVEVLVAAMGSDDVTSTGEVLVRTLRRRWYTNLTGMYQAERTPMRVLFDGGEWTDESIGSLRLIPATDPAR